MVVVLGSAAACGGTTSIESSAPAATPVAGDSNSQVDEDDDTSTEADTSDEVEEADASAETGTEQPDDAGQATVYEVEFPPGEFGAFVSDSVLLGERIVYTVEAAAGQSMILALTSLEDNAVYTVDGPGVHVEEQTSGAILLPETAIYEIEVGGTRGNAEFALDIYVYPTEEVRFDPGTSGTVVSSAVVQGERAVYVLGAATGQTMTVSITSVEDNAVFDVYPPSGPAMVIEATDAELSLTADGDYQLVAGGTRGNATYELTISIL